MSCRIRGSYFESCNCDGICPCRRINGLPGGRSTHGVCMGVLSWLIEDERLQCAYRGSCGYGSTFDYAGS
jgi:hypothetical protein